MSENMNNPLFSLHYLPCIAYFKKIVLYETIVIETQENYIKQSYRNRCEILSANGVLPLIIPINHQSNQLISEIKTQTDTNWKRHHWQSIISAYNSSPYFLYYKDGFEDIYQNENIDDLFQFNLALFKLCLKLLKLETQIVFTQDYQKNIELDFRNAFNAKQTLENLEVFKPYYQVFDSKYSFQPNLSIIDLLFSQGPYSKSYLHELATNTNLRQ